MRLTIIPSDGVVGIDGEFRVVSMDGMDPTIHAVQFNDALGEGQIEFTARGAATVIKSREIFAVFVDRWFAAAPPLPDTPVPKAPQQDVVDEVAALPADRLAALKQLLT